MTFAIRRARADDIPGLIDLLAEVAAEERWIHTTPDFDRAERAAAIAQTLTSTATACFVAQEPDGRLAGQITFGFWTGDAPIRFGMLVRAGMRGRGVGSALLEAGLAWCRERGEPLVQLEVYPHNDAALALYRKFGFAEVERRIGLAVRPNGQRWDIIVMHLRLAQDSAEPLPP